MSVRTTASALASALPALLLSAHFAWAIAAPELPWNAELLRNAGAVVMCEFFLVHAAGMSVAIAGGLFGKRALAGAGLAAFYAFFLFGFSRYIESAWTLAAVGALIGGRLAGAVLSPPPSSGGLPRAFLNLGAFILVLALTSAKLPWFGMFYFAIQGLIELAPALRSGDQSLEPDCIPVGSHTVRIRYSGEGLEVFSNGRWGDADILLFMAAAGLGLGVTALVHGRGGLAVAFGFVATIGGAGLLLGAAIHATRSIRLLVRRGELVWTRSAFDGAEPERRLSLEEVGRLDTQLTMSDSKHHERYALCVGTASGRPWIDGFATRGDAAALGKLIVAELRYGPAARDAVRREPDVAALLSGSKPA